MANQVIAALWGLFTVPVAAHDIFVFADFESALANTIANP